MKKKNVVLAAVAAAVVTMVAGCGNQAANNTSQGDGSQTTGKVTGSFTMAGSTSMEKMARATNEVFMNTYPGTNVTAEFIGSGAGIESVLSGSAKVANVSRNLTDEEKAEGIVENIVAIDGIGVVVNPSNEVDDLTKEQLADIYTGEIKNWSEVGGSDEPIVVIGREASSGTREAFESILELEECSYSNELDNTGAVIAKVSAVKGAIGYVSLDVIDDSVKALKMDGVEATAENIKNGTYFLQRPFVMGTKGEIEEQEDIIQAYFEFLQSDEGKAVIEQVGLITVD
ncbi:MAG TPA: phosphate ABC transporter substrate-binding protein [Candidatus Fimimorpha faecalis]|uniref:Phosphate-binding protein n=1 Tax=Candidatus Fimimorpha faecalis TaxID=2840824 RepID=A0A9D1JD10_9FIRM|nr:phosphate ABC transporter substrate-binding protein [Candidatus Fimimorpha faecalis]